MSEPLKKTTGKALFWSFIDKGGQQVIQLVFGCILARLLMPEEFGLIAVLAIFTAVANILQESGFSSALIRKKAPHPEEFSSVFYFNIAISIIAYIILFMGAPLIADFYEKPILTSLSRFIFLAFVFNSFGIIQNVNLVRKMDFKTNTRITLIAGTISGLIAIIMAIKGYGAWSLAAQLVTQAFLRSIMLWIFVKWIPKTGFSFPHLRAMSIYSIKLLLTAILNQVCANIYAIIIGKHFSLSQSGFYSQANKLSAIPQSTISDGLKNVAFPVLTQVGDDEERQLRAFRKIMRITAFISFPVALILIVMAKPIITILLSDKWVEATPILQILAVGGAFFPLYCLVQSLLQSHGKSGRILGIETFRNILSLVLILVSINFGILGLVSGLSLVNIIAFFTSIVIIGRYCNYSIADVLMDILPYMGIAAISFAPCYLFYYLIDNIYILFGVQLIAGGFIYLLLMKILGSVVLKDAMDFAKQLIKK